MVGAAEVVRKDQGLKAAGEGEGGGNAIAQPQMASVAIELRGLDRALLGLQVVAVEHIDRLDRTVRRRCAPLNAKAEQIKRGDIGGVEVDIIGRKVAPAQHVGDRGMTEAGFLTEQGAQEALGGIGGVQDHLLALQQQRQAHERIGQFLTTQGQHQRIPKAFVEVKLGFLGGMGSRFGAKVSG